MHICVSKLTIIGSDNGLSPGRRQAIIWTNAGILLIGPLGTNFSAIWIGIQTFSFKKMRLKVSFAKRQPFCLGLNVLKDGLNHKGSNKYTNSGDLRRSQAKAYLSLMGAFLHLEYPGLKGPPPIETSRVLPLYNTVNVTLSHCCDVIMGVMASEITSLTQSFIQAQIKENIKAPRHWPFAGNSPVAVEFPTQMASNAENVSIWWRHHACRLAAITGTAILVPYHLLKFLQWASSQMRKIAGCACTGNAGNVFPTAAD